MCIRDRYYTVNTYPVSVLEYSREELEEAYNQTYGQEGFKFRIETKMCIRDRVVV